MVEQRRVIEENETMRGNAIPSSFSPHMTRSQHILITRTMQAPAVECEVPPRTSKAPENLALHSMFANLK